MTMYFRIYYVVSRKMKIFQSPGGSSCGLLIQSGSCLGGSGTFCRGRGLLSYRKTALVTDFPSFRFRGWDFGDESFTLLVRTLFSWCYRRTWFHAPQIGVIAVGLYPGGTSPAAARLRILLPISDKHFSSVLILVKTISILPNFPEKFQIQSALFLAN